MKLPEGEYTLIWVGIDGRILNPKGHMGMNPDKAVGAIKWTRRIFGEKFPCFVYDPLVETIFNDDGTKNEEKIQELVRRFKTEI